MRLPAPLNLEATIHIVRDYGNVHTSCNMLVLDQVRAIISSRTALAKTSFHAKLQLATRGLVERHDGNPALLSKLAQAGVLPPRASTVTLCSPMAVSQALQMLGFPEPLQLVFSSLSTKQRPRSAATAANGPLPNGGAYGMGAELAPPPPPMPANVVTGEEHDDLYYTTHKPFPVRLHEYHASPDAVPMPLSGVSRAKMEYLPETMPLKAELLAFTQWCLNPLQLDREARHISITTMDEHFKAIARYCGFLQTTLSVSDDDMSLRLYTNQDYLCQYFSYLNTKIDNTQAFCNHVYRGVRVINYLQTIDGPDSPARAEHLRRVGEWLHALSRTMKRAYPHGKLVRDHDAAPPALPSKLDILMWQLSLKDEALQPLAEAEAPACDAAGAAAAAVPVPLSKYQAQVMHDWVLSEMMCNHLPPVRLFGLRTVSAPFADGVYRCSDPDCKITGCRGNRLELHPSMTYGYEHERISMQPCPLDLCGWLGVHAQAAHVHGADVTASKAADAGGGSHTVAGSAAYEDACMAAAAACDDTPTGIKPEPRDSTPPPPHATAAVLIASDSITTTQFTSAGGKHVRFTSPSPDSCDDTDDDTPSMQAGYDSDDDNECISLLTSSSEGYDDDDDEDAIMEMGAGDGSADDDADGDAVDDGVAAEAPVPPIITRLSVDVPLMRLVMPHHKMEARWGRFCLEVQLPHELALALHVYMTHAYPVLNPDRSHRCLFMRPNGRVLEAKHLSSLWQDIQATHSAPWTPFPPKAFRDIHVVDRVMDLSAAMAFTGTHLDGDGAIMQNTPHATWQRAYCKDGAYFREMVKGTVDRMCHARLTMMLQVKERLRVQLDGIASEVAAAEGMQADGGDADDSLHETAGWGMPSTSAGASCTAAAAQGDGGEHDSYMDACDDGSDAW